MLKRNSHNNNGNPMASYARYSAIALQMGIIIAAGVFGGYKADQLLHLPFPLFTLILSMVSVAGSIWLLIKETTTKDKER